MTRQKAISLLLIGTALASTALIVAACASYERTPPPENPTRLADVKPILRDLLAKYRTADDARLASEGCFTCHDATDAPTMHRGSSWHWSCIDCHGGDATVRRPSDVPGERPFTKDYLALMHQAHVQPRYPDAWADPQTGEYSSANPVRSYTLLNYEDPDFIQFVNPGDLRIADRTCGQCHAQIVANVRKSMMNHGAQLWGAALYNNGSYPHKLPRFGESYSVNGVPQRLLAVPRPTAAERARGVIDLLDPLPRWEVTQMGNILRAFERGGKIPRVEVDSGLPTVTEEPGKPDMKLGDRGLGTQLATDPVYLGLQKTRLLDPNLSFMGTNDHPGDFRHSGCTACHVIYANDRSPVHSGHYASAGHLGKTKTIDPTINRDELGHPIRHEMTRAIPNSQCIVCHVHPGTSYANSYLGFMWWDNETHGDMMYPKTQARPTAEQVHRGLMSNPEAASLRGLWSNLYPGQEDHRGEPSAEDFLENLTDLNKKMDRTQFADFHGHGWVFKAVFKKDRDGRLLDADDKPVPTNDPTQLAKQLGEAVAFQSKTRGQRMPPGHPVHLKDIHLERGMHCTDCHFMQDVHGDGKLYGEVRNAIEIDCIDCHGTISARANLTSSGPAGGNSLLGSQTPFGASRFYWKGDQLVQRSAMDPKIEWEVPQVFDSVADPADKRYNERAARAKLIQKGGERRTGGLLSETLAEAACPKNLAHDNDNMTCYACHTSWMTSCFGCHLPMRANFRMPMLHNEGLVLRNYTTYNYQVLRDDIFMLGRDSSVKQGKIAPVRSSSAVVVGSANANREWVYSQQQTISSDGYSGQAFNPHFPHAVRTTETRQCSDCHLSESNDNNAWMAQLLLQGTNFVNFLGRYVYVGLAEHGFEAVAVTEREEPQAVIGSYLHEMAWPKNFQRHVRNGCKLREAFEHKMNDGPLLTGGEILDVQMRGEYLYAARGSAGFYAYDIANIDNKGFSERLITAPVSPFGQNLSVRTRYATAVASPTTLGVDPTRKQNPANQEQPIAPVYAYLYVTDKYEGLVVVGDPTMGVGTLLDGDPMNNFLRRATAFNPDGELDGAVNITMAGNLAYICCDRGLRIVDLTNPLEPAIVGRLDSSEIKEPTAVAVQFRYAFICDSDGLKVVDITSPKSPRVKATVRFEGANRLYIARTHAYVAARENGLAIIDIENPERPGQPRFYNADGEITDARDVKIGMTNASLFAYVADGVHGLRVLQLFSPDSKATFAGFSPDIDPDSIKLIATYHTPGTTAVALSKGLDRDRAVDESGNQTAVFGRIGAKPLSLEDQRKMYLRKTDNEVYRVRDDPPRTDDRKSRPVLQ
jgi:hypothetical protein